MKNISRVSTSISCTILFWIACSVSASAGSLEDTKLKSTKLFESLFKGTCFAIEDGVEQPYDVHVINTKKKDGEEAQLILIGYLCDRAAYNTSEVWILTDNYGQTAPLSFSQPSVEFKFSDQNERKLISWKLQGIFSVPQLSGSGYDPKEQQLTTFHKWRGLGDASEGGIYKLIEGRFVLVNYEIDPTYDEEINPIKVISYSGTNQ